MNIDLNTSTLHTANDNGAIPLCEACEERPAASKDHMLCAACVADINARIDERDLFFPYDANDMGAADYFPGKH